MPPVVVGAKDGEGSNRHPENAGVTDNIDGATHEVRQHVAVLDESGALDVIREPFKQATERATVPVPEEQSMDAAACTRARHG